MPVSVKVPAPCLVKPPVELLITPSNWVLVALPVVKVPAPSVTLPPAAPPPARLPMVTLLPFRFSTAAATLARLTLLPTPNALVLAADKPPAFTLVAPVYRFAPLRVNVPAPCFVNPPIPLITPSNEVLPALPEVSVPAPRVRLPPVPPPPARLPMVRLLPFKSSATPTAFASVTSLPDPSAVVLPACRLPPLIAVAPL